MTHRPEHDLELIDGVYYYAGTNKAPDFTSPYWTKILERERREKLAMIPQVYQYLPDSRRVVLFAEGDNAIQQAAQVCVYYPNADFNFFVAQAEIVPLEEPKSMRVVMSVPMDDVFPPSIGTKTEEYYAQLVEDCPSYHFFIMEVKV